MHHSVNTKLRCLGTDEKLKSGEVIMKQEVNLKKKKVNLQNKT